MGLLNDVKAVKEADVKVDNSDKKAHAKERKAAKKAALAKVLAALKANPIKGLESEIELLTKVPERTGFGGGVSTLTKVFGTETPAKGTKISATEVFTKAGFGYPEMRKQMKKWAERKANPVIVELDPATSTYIVK